MTRAASMAQIDARRGVPYGAAAPPDAAARQRDGFGPVLNGCGVCAYGDVRRRDVLRSVRLLARPAVLAGLRRRQVHAVAQDLCPQAPARILPGYWLALIVSFVLSITLFSVALNGELLRFAAGFLLVADRHR